MIEESYKGNENINTSSSQFNHDKNTINKNNHEIKRKTNLLKKKRTRFISTRVRK